MKQELLNEIKDAFCDINFLKDTSSCINKIQNTNIISSTTIESMQLGSGNVNVKIEIKEELFYKTLSEITGVTIENEGDLFSIISTLSKTKQNMTKLPML